MSRQAAGELCRGITNAPHPRGSGSKGPIVVVPVYEPKRRTIPELTPAGQTPSRIHFLGYSSHGGQWLATLDCQPWRVSHRRGRVDVCGNCLVEGISGIRLPGDRLGRAIGSMNAPQVLPDRFNLCFLG